MNKAKKEAQRKISFGKIGVLMGGPSSERKISLKSGKAILEALRGLGLKAKPINIKTDSIRENKRLLRRHGIDCAFIALHGRFGEDGAIQSILESIGMPYTGSGILASRLAMDKVASRRIFALNGLSVPKYTVVEKISRGKIEEVCSGFYLPLVVKPASQGSSIGLSIIESQQELKRASDQAFKFDERVIIEEYIEGRELTVGVLDGMALPVIEIVPKNKFFDYQAKYTKGMTEYIVPARLSAKITRQVQQAALSAHRLLDCYGCSRVDAILGKDGKLYILEVNTIPGFTTTSLLPKAAKHCGIDFAQLCLRLLKTAYEKDQKKNPG